MLNKTNSDVLISISGDEQWYKKLVTQHPGVSLSRIRINPSASSLFQQSTFFSAHTAPRLALSENFKARAENTISNSM